LSNKTASNSAKLLLSPLQPQRSDSQIPHTVIVALCQHSEATEPGSCSQQQTAQSKQMGRLQDLSAILTGLYDQPLLGPNQTSCSSSRGLSWQSNCRICCNQQHQQQLNTTTSAWSTRPLRQCMSILLCVTMWQAGLQCAVANTTQRCTCLSETPLHSTDNNLRQLAPGGLTGPPSVCAFHMLQHQTSHQKS